MSESEVIDYISHFKNLRKLSAFNQNTTVRLTSKKSKHKRKND